MNHEVIVAVLRLQDSLMRGRLQPWRAEQTEEALNALLAKPDRTGDPFHLERNALSDARKKLQRRAELLALHVDEIEVMAEAEPGSPRSPDTGFEGLRAEVFDLVERRLGATDQRILAIAHEGGTAGDVAEALGIDYAIAKVRLSRARARARHAWEENYPNHRSGLGGDPISSTTAGMDQ